MTHFAGWPATLSSRGSSWASKKGVHFPPFFQNSNFGPFLPKKHSFCSPHRVALLSHSIFATAPPTQAFSYSILPFHIQIKLPYSIVSLHSHTNLVVLPSSKPSFSHHCYPPVVMQIFLYSIRAITTLLQ